MFRLHRRRRPRCLTAFLVVLALLCAQFALAAYVCPGPAMQMAMSGCDGDMDPQQPALCHQHAAEPGQVAAAPQLPVASPPALIQVLALPVVPDAAVVLALPPSAEPEAQPPPDPLFLSTLRLRV